CTVWMIAHQINDLVTIQTDSSLPVDFSGRRPRRSTDSRLRMWITWKSVMSREERAGLRRRDRGGLAAPGTVARPPGRDNRGQERGEDEGAGTAQETERRGEACPARP